MATPTATGTVDFDAKAGKPCQTWYQVYGDLKSGVTPVVALHGGPGSTHHYLLPLLDLFTKHSIPVVFYDQIGNGNSTHLPEKSGDQASFWTEQLFLDELDNLLSHLGIQDNYTLIGHSWGGMLASRHASKQPKGLKQLVLANAPASLKLFAKAAVEENLPQLPAETQDAIRKNEAAGTPDSEAYKAATLVYYKTFMYRADPWPTDFIQTLGWLMKDTTVRHAMYGPAEFTVLGTLKDWSIEDEAHKINVPTLLINGEHDTVTDNVTRPFFKAIPKVRWYTFAGASHSPHSEMREKFIQLVAEFLTT
ncbi:prolyl aminopeptidase-2 [Lenzites betulinus]|nr:prolyl aminopeptidase-2 [Lenzites betulinus]